MPVEMNPDRASYSCDFPVAEEKEEAQKCPAPSSEAPKACCGEKQGMQNLQAQASWSQRLKYEASLAFTQWKAGPWWSKIEPYNIYLGALPLQNKGHFQQILDLGIHQVISVVEDFEMEDGYLNSPVKAVDWKKKGIDVKQIKAVDFLPLTREEIKTGIQELAESLKGGKTVYIHCKAGRGRSATIVIAYLMQHQLMSFDDAFALVQNARPQINLNSAQRQAILDYFDLAPPGPIGPMGPTRPVGPTGPVGAVGPVAPAAQNIAGYAQITEEKLTQILKNMLDYVIDGSSYPLGQHAPELLAGWMPSVTIESTLSRRNRYLSEYNGDQNAAAEASIARNHGFMRRFKVAVVGAVPFVGAPTSYSISLWHQLREIALIAAIHGHDVHNPEVKMKILSAVVDGNLLKLPAASVDLIARQIIKKVLVKAGLNAMMPALPAHLIFNYFTDNAAKVSTHAKAIFAGENSICIPREEYAPNQAEVFCN
jgi:protein-tyrosine phosphatase